MAWRGTSALLLLLLLARPAGGAPSEALVGRWYAEGVERGVYIQFIEERRADGSFSLEVRTRMSCETARSSRESGSWDYADGTLRKWTRMVGGQEVADGDYFHDEFAMSAIDDDHMAALDAKTHISWSLTRVPRDFALPLPPHCVNS